jgi:hypothetical protein
MDSALTQGMTADKWLDLNPKIYFVPLMEAHMSTLSTNKNLSNRMLMTIGICLALVSGSSFAGGMSEQVAKRANTGGQEMVDVIVLYKAMPSQAENKRAASLNAKVRQEAEALGWQTVRSDDWSAMELAVTLFVHNARSSSEERLVDQASQLLLEQVLLQLPDDDTQGSALLGVTKPTFLRRKTSFQKQQCQDPDDLGSTSRASS